MMISAGCPRDLDGGILEGLGMKVKYTELVPVFKANLQAVFELATTDELVEGLAWYRVAREAILDLAAAHGVSPAVAVLIVAALSPQCKWEDNLAVAEQIFARKPKVRSFGGCLKANILKAQDILRESATTLDAHFREAPKVRAFAANLGGNLDAVTVDTHAGQAAWADPLHNGKWTLAQYRVIASVYQKLALEVGLQPAALQAVVWVVWKRLYQPGAKRALSRAS